MVRVLYSREARGGRDQDSLPPIRRRIPVNQAHPWLRCQFALPQHHDEGDALRRGSRHDLRQSRGCSDGSPPSFTQRWTSKSLRSCGPSSRSFRPSSSTAAFPITLCRSTCTTTCKTAGASASLGSRSSWGSCQRRRFSCTPPSYIGTSTTGSRSPRFTAPSTTSRERSSSGSSKRWLTTGARVMQTRTRPYSPRSSNSWATALMASSSKRWSGRTKPCTHEMRTRLTNIFARPGSKISKRSATRTRSTRSSFARTSSPSKAHSKWAS